LVPFAVSPVFPVGALLALLAAAICHAGIAALPLEVPEAFDPSLFGAEDTGAGVDDGTGWGSELLLLAPNPEFPVPLDDI